MVLRRIGATLLMALALLFSYPSVGSCGSMTQEPATELETITMSKQDFNELRMILVESKETLQQAQKQLDDSNRALAIAKQQLANSEQQISLLREQLATQKQEISTLKTQLNTASSSLTDAQLSLINTQTNVEHREKEHEKTEKALRTQRDAWKLGTVLSALIFGIAF